MVELAPSRGLIQLPVIAAHHSRRLVYAGFVFSSGGLSIGIITAVAYGAGHPLVVPSLGPTAFLVFNRAQSSASRPRNIVIGHLIGAVCGYVALVSFGLGHAPAVVEPGGLTAARIGAAALSIALTSAVMILLGVEHGPAGATTLIVSLGFMTTIGSLGLLMIGVVVLAAEGVVIDRLVGLRLPFWSGEPDALRPRAILRRTRPPAVEPDVDSPGGKGAGKDRKGKDLGGDQRSHGGDRPAGGEAAGGPHAEGRGRRPAGARLRLLRRPAGSHPWLSRPGEGRQVAVAGAERCTVKVEDAQAGGSYSLVEVTLDPGLPATLLHVHYDFAESYFVLDGEVSAEVGGDTARAGPGSVIQVAPSVPHLLNPAGRSGARYLCITPRSQQSQPEFLP